jgi:hypothetical protein
MTEQLEIFFGALESIARAQRLLDREFATDFSVTELLRPDENRLSDVIACLLNPAGVHGHSSTCFSRCSKFLAQPTAHVAVSHGSRVGSTSWLRLASGSVSELALRTSHGLAINPIKCANTAAIWRSNFLDGGGSVICPGMACPRMNAPYAKECVRTL